MNSFVANRSTLCVLLSWFFAVAFINDAANLTDIIPQAATVHYDGGECVEALAQFNALRALSSTCGSVGREALQTHTYCQPPIVTLRRVILDEDSPSIAAISLQTEFTFFFLPQEETPLHRNHNSDSPLYLQNCTLLI
jgi:hypothetical protein